MSSFQRQWTRREFIQTTGAVMATTGALELRAQQKREYGVQLYTVRTLLPTKAAETLKAIAAAGYREAEVVNEEAAPRVIDLAKQAGLMPVSIHVLAPVVTDAGFDRFAASMRALGLSYVVVAYLMPNERASDAAGYRALADRLNKAGEVARREGLTLGYHNHGFEFVPLADGQSGYDVLTQQLDPALVTFEVDLFWVAMAGLDPAALLGKLGKRASLVHLKDKAKGITAEANEMKVKPEAFAEVGAGTLDFPGILAAARTAGVQHYFVEQDQTPGDPLVSLEKSAKYLRSLA